MTDYYFGTSKFYSCIEKCFECASSCWISADAFLSEQDAQSYHPAVEECLRCAAVMGETVNMLMKADQFSPEQITLQLGVCRETCQHCAENVSAFCKLHEHCLICIQCCEECAQSCERYLNDFQTVA